MTEFTKKLFVTGIAESNTHLVVTGTVGSQLTVWYITLHQYIFKSKIAGSKLAI